MTAIPVPHPPFVKWPVEVDIVMGGREYMTESITDLFSGKEKGKREYPLLTAAMSKRYAYLASDGCDKNSQYNLYIRVYTGNDFLICNQDHS